MRLLCVLLAWCLAKAAKVYRCKWPRSVLSSGDPNLMVTVDGSEVRCDRTGDANYICPAACDYGQSNPDSCLVPLKMGVFAILSGKEIASPSTPWRASTPRMRAPGVGTVIALQTWEVLLAMNLVSVTGVIR